jgi:hypothetical protein
MKKLIALIAVIGTVCCILFSAAAADASVVGPCVGQGVTSTDDEYGTCGVTQPGHASATFSTDGSTVTLQKSGSDQVASFWQSNGAEGATPGWVCVVVTVNVSGRAGGQQQLVVTANGVTRYQTFPLSSGTQWYCLNLGSSAPSFLWQLITYLGDKPSGKATVTETLIGVTTR